jgi:hypothetical protein
MRLSVCCIRFSVFDAHALISLLISKECASVYLCVQMCVFIVSLCRGRVLPFSRNQTILCIFREVLEFASGSGPALIFISVGIIVIMISCQQSESQPTFN